MNNKKLHTSVLLQETIELLNIKPNGVYVDCTLGEGGHSYEILKQLNENASLSKGQGKLISIDQDAEAIEFTKNFFKKDKLVQAALSTGKWNLLNMNFNKFSLEVLKQTLNIEKIDGVIMDLGFSSRQIGLEGRGFSYQNEDDLLDMRMDPNNQTVMAKDLLNGLTEFELEKLFRTYGEERYARRISNAIKTAPQPIETVGQLNKLINGAIPAGSLSSSGHPSRRVYQALRIAVNDELNSLKDVINNTQDLLNPGGRIVIISFHSLEDRIVKQSFRKLEKSGEGSVITKKPLLPSEEEVKANSRSHSAKLRTFEKD